MTERFSGMLRDQAAALDVPAAPASDILAAGKRRRRRRTALTAGGAAAAVLVAGVLAATLSTWRAPDDVEPARLPDDVAYQRYGAWASGDEVRVGNHVAVVRGAQALGYTSAGALVYSAGSGTSGASGGGLPASQVTLVAPDGSTHRLRARGLDGLDRRPPATDATSPYIAFLRRAEAPRSWQPVVVDVRTDREVYVGPALSGSNWGDPDVPTWIAGDFLTYSGPDGLVRVDWRTGRDAPLHQEGLTMALGYAHDEYVAVSRTGHWQVRSASDGSVLLDVPGVAGSLDRASLSVDGRFLAVSNGLAVGDAPVAFRVYDVSTRSAVSFGGTRDLTGYGWTPDGHLVGKPDRQQTSEVEVCDPVDGRCVGTGLRRDGALTLVAGAPGVSPAGA